MKEDCGPSLEEFLLCSSATSSFWRKLLKSSGALFHSCSQQILTFRCEPSNHCVYFNVEKAILNLPVLSVSKTNTPCRAVQAEIPVLQVSGTRILAFPVLLFMTNTRTGSERDATACIASNCASSNLLLGFGSSRQEPCSYKQSLTGWIGHRGAGVGTCWLVELALLPVKAGSCCS